MELVKIKDGIDLKKRSKSGVKNTCITIHGTYFTSLAAPSDDYCHLSIALGRSF